GGSGPGGPGGRGGGGPGPAGCSGRTRSATTTCCRVFGATSWTSSDMPRRHEPSSSAPPDSPRTRPSARTSSTARATPDDAAMSPRPALPDWHRSTPIEFAPDRAHVQRWLDADVAARQSYDPAAIGDLWTEDAQWVYPFGVRARGRDAIVAEWLAERDLFAGRGYDAAYEPIAIDGGLVVTHGRTLFFDPITSERQ